jgi:cation:H+ antiporter
MDYMMLEIVLGIIFLFISSEFLIRSSNKLSISLKINPLLVGLTFIAFITALPDGITSIIAQTHFKSSDLALGNIIGSNIANIGLIFGCLLIFKPSVMKKVKIKKDLYFLLLATAVFALFLFIQLSFVEGVIFLILFFIIMSYQIKSRIKVSTKQTSIKNTDSKNYKKISLEIFFIIVSLSILLASAYFFINGAEKLALKYDISKRVISLSLVALGSSLPEFTISIVSMLRKKAKISVGNILGSNLFNTLFFCGIIAMIRPLDFSKSFLYKDLPFLIFFTLLFFLSTFLKKEKFLRMLGSVTLVCYLSYLWFLVF